MSGQASAAAPAASGNTQGSQASSKEGSGGAGANGSQGTGAGAFDYQSAFKSQSKKLQDTQQSLSQFQQEWEGKKGDLELVSKLKGVFEPPKGGEQAESPVGEWERQLDFYIEQAVEAKNRGQGIPLTANLAISHFKAQIENYNTQQEQKKLIQELRQRLDHVQDPSHNLNQRAFYNFDTHIKNGLERVYGKDQSTLPQRQAQFRAIGQQVSAAIQDLMQKNPQRWDQMRRDPAEIEQLANRALRMNMPPKAVQMIEQENLRNTPMSMGELRRAFKEADSIKDESERTRVKTSIRQDILAMSMGGQSMAG